MNKTGLFYQGDGVAEIEYLEVDLEGTFGDLKARLIAQHGCAPDVLLFLEDEEAPLGDVERVKDRTGDKPLKLHVNRCRQISVTVAYNGQTVDRKFPPGATVARVKHWAAESKLGMTPEEAGEHVLQISGTHQRPAPGVHVGTLAARNHCTVAFDLVADQRVNGAPEMAVERA